MKRAQRTLIILTVSWLCAVGAGQRILFNFETTPGSNAAPDRWPAGSQIPLHPERATLIMVAHPRCSCTRASVGELAEIMTRLQGRVSAYVLFIRPNGSSQQWLETDLWRSAAAIPGVTVLEDDSGREAARFGAAVSGQTLLFDPAGRLLFRGGITAARGHSGDNAGRSAVVTLVSSGSGQSQNPVLGCALHDPSPDVLQQERSWKQSVER